MTIHMIKTELQRDYSSYYDEHSFSQVLLSGTTFLLRIPSTQTKRQFLLFEQFIAKLIKI